MNEANEYSLETTAVPEPFVSSHREVLSALVSYGAAWIYTYFFTASSDTWLAVFAAVFTVWVLAHDRGVAGAWEHWVWLGCMWLCIGCTLLGRNQVWGTLTWLFVHGYAIYWVLCRSGRLVQGSSSAYLPVDAVNGAITWPMKHFFCFLRTRVLAWGLRQRREREDRPAGTGGYVLLALCVGVGLFAGAAYLLSQADDNFADLLQGLKLPLDSSRISAYILRFFLSIPIGAYLFGLVAGVLREKPETLERQQTGIRRFLTALGKVPNGVWTVLVGAFVAMYLVFFWIQGAYLFGAFGRNLPEGFTVAQYARQGFFELCKVMALNFALLWLVLYSSMAPVARRLSSKIMCTALLAESILFAVTALSKLYLYISCFGFTPLRLQSLWLVCVLTVGCVCCLVSLWTGRKTSKVWIFFTGISLALLHLY